MRLVLLRPRNAENLGAIARAMANFGLEDWAVVAPNPLLLSSEGARKLAVQSSRQLEWARVVADLASAVADCDWVVGTTMRRLAGRRRLTPRQLASEARTRRKVALVFGDERNGLTNDDLSRCHDVSFIPTDRAQPSLNLAQAALVYCYELFAAEMSEQAPPGPRPATDGELRLVETSLAEALAKGFLRRDGGKALSAMMAPLLRSHLSQKEARLWTAALKAIAKGDRHPAYSEQVPSEHVRAESRKR